MNAGASVADQVVLLAGVPTPGMEARLADKQAIIADAGVQRFSLFEYIYPANAQILPAIPTCCAEKDAPLTEAELKGTLHDPQDASSISQPRYAAGMIFTPALF